jgi:hypothetical protein
VQYIYWGTTAISSPFLGQAAQRRGENWMFIEIRDKSAQEFTERCISCRLMVDGRLFANGERRRENVVGRI